MLEFLLIFVQELSKIVYYNVLTAKNIKNGTPITFEGNFLTFPPGVDFINLYAFLALKMLKKAF